MCVIEVIWSHEIKSDPDNDDDDKYDDDNDNDDDNGNDNGNNNDPAVRHTLPLVVTLEIIWSCWCENDSDSESKGNHFWTENWEKLSWWLNGLHIPHDSSHILM